MNLNLTMEITLTLAVKFARVWAFEMGNNEMINNEVPSERGWLVETVDGRLETRPVYIFPPHLLPIRRAKMRPCRTV